MTKLVQEMRLLIREEKRCQEKVDNLPADVVNTFKTLQPLFWVYNSSRVMLDELTSIEDEVIQGTDRLTSVTTRLEQAEEERKIFYSDNPLCPLCGNAWDGKECTDGS